MKRVTKSIDDVTGQAVFYDFGGCQLTEMGGKEAQEMYNTACFSSVGDTAILTGMDTLSILCRDQISKTWTRVVKQTVCLNDSATRGHCSVLQIQNLSPVTCLAWKEDGSKIAIGTGAGGVELLDVYLRKYIHSKTFEFTHINHSSVVSLSRQLIS